MVIEKPEEAFNSRKDNQLNLTITKDDDIRLNVYEKQNKCAVIGATGYTGLDLVLLLSKHPRVSIKYLCASRNLGKKIISFDKRIKKNLPKILSVNKINWKNLDLVFLSLPNGEAQKIILKKYFKYPNLKFIDLSADFRIKNPTTYYKNYRIKHNAIKLIKKSFIQYLN
jgi:N-acetyl-gamma-glutamyl-phosphate reductase